MQNGVAVLRSAIQTVQRRGEPLQGVVALTKKELSGAK